MIISLERPIFKTHPDIRFSKRKNLPEGFLNEMYRRYITYGYTFEDLADFYNIKTRKRLNRISMWKWICRIEAYDLAQIAIKKGAKECNINYFGRSRYIVLKDIKYDVLT